MVEDEPEETVPTAKRKTKAKVRLSTRNAYSHSSLQLRAQTSDETYPAPKRKRSSAVIDSDADEVCYLAKFQLVYARG